MNTAGAFANHAHVFPPEVNPNGTIDALLRLLDECDIARAACFAPFASQFAAKGIDGCCNDWLARELRSRSDRLVGVGTIDFSRPNVADQVKHVASLGFRALKLHPNAQDVGVLDARALAAYEAAQAHDLMIFFHTGVHQSRLNESRVLLFDEIAWRCPTLRFSLEHVGGYHFFNEALAVLFNHKPPPWNPGKNHVFAGLTSVFSQKTNRFWYLNREQLLEIVLQIGVEQMIFGLDFPYNGVEETKLGIETVRGLGLSEGETNLMLGGNLARELCA